MPLAAAIDLVTDAVVAAGRRGVPLVGMKLDYDLTILDVLGSRLLGRGLLERGWCGPVLDAGVLDRHFDGEREGRRTLGDLCAHYGVELEDAHDAWFDASPRWAWSSRWRIAMPRCGTAGLRVCTRRRSTGTASGPRTARRGAARRGRAPSTRGSTCGRWPRRCSRGGLSASSGVSYFLSRSQTMSTPSSSASTTLAGCFLSMWPTRPLYTE